VHSNSGSSVGGTSGGQRDEIFRAVPHKRRRRLFEVPIEVSWPATVFRRWDVSSFLSINHLCTLITSCNQDWREDICPVAHCHGVQDVYTEMTAVNGFVVIKTGMKKSVAKPMQLLSYG
jgi:hypothetical protein